ncbi:hypothetical protein [Belnapia moabensis]|uniref:hypothetical protein n=1 Tax=Belnapia moabensis TaxID=365533 RepID=UPI0012ED119D|nr:hypothetical protein [Belnapia moabensis]
MASLKVLVICCFFMTGCGFSEFADRATNPIVLDLMRDKDLWATYNYETVSTDAARRTIFIQYRRGGTRADFVCAEPPPDALQAYTNALAAAVKGGGAESVALELKRTFGTNAAPMLYRSQGLQFLRDQVFNACLMMMNGVIDAPTYRALLPKLLEASVDLIKNEQQAVQIAAGRQPAALTPGSAPATAGGSSTDAGK